MRALRAMLGPNMARTAKETNPPRRTPRRAAAEARRTPRQARSRETRDAIVEAAARLFSEGGLRRTTTAQVARLAGVSPGSMYQYFPSKEALVAAIYEREADRQQAELVARVAEIGTDDAPALIRALVAATVATLERDRALTRVMFEELPRVAGLRTLAAADKLAAQTIRALLAAARDRVRPRDLDVAAMLVVRATRYTVLSLLDEPLDGPGHASFVDELSDMLSSYLLSPRPWRDTPR